MLISRGSQLLKLSKNIQAKSKIATSAVRSHGDTPWSYRCPTTPPPKSVYLAADVLGALAWWWIFWHLFTEPEHIYGEFPYPEPSNWTDEELGIPAGH